MISRLFFILLLFSAFARGQFLIDPYRYAATATNYYAEGDAADPAVDSNTVSSNWETGGQWTFTSSSTQAYDGTYSIAFARTAAGGTEKGPQLSGLPDNTALTVSVWVYVLSSVEENPRMRTRTFDGWADNYIQVFTGSRDTWVNYTLAVTTDASTDPRTFNFEHIDPDDTGTNFYIDKIEITE